MKASRLKYGIRQLLRYTALLAVLLLLQQQK